MYVSAVLQAAANMIKTYSVIPKPVSESAVDIRCYITVLESWRAATSITYVTDTVMHATYSSCCS